MGHDVTNSPEDIALQVEMNEFSPSVMQRMNNSSSLLSHWGINGRGEELVLVKKNLLTTWKIFLFFRNFFLEW